MKLFTKNKAINENSEDLLKRLSFCEEMQQVMLRSMQALFIFIKEFALDIKELDPKQYRIDVDNIQEQYETETKPHKLELFFKKESGKITAFIARQRKYLDEREKELREIIDLMAKAMSNINSDNQTFYQRVYDQSEKIEQISALDDIKKIKFALKEEVDKMRNIVDLKKVEDDTRIEKLASQVDSLKAELAQAKSKSMTDGLTGVYNRQAFDAYIRDRIDRNTPIKSGYSLLLLDIDDFKVINDTYGHIMGDRVLVAFAQKCQGLVRSEDFLARYGGEEFVILLSGASLRNAAKKAEVLCKKVAGTRYAIDEGQNDSYLSVTVSIGVSTLKRGEASKALIERADKALYIAKASGKNCVITEKKVK
jgi:diguanylate cyclase